MGYVTADEEPSSKHSLVPLKTMMSPPRVSMRPTTGLTTGTIDTAVTTGRA